MLTLHQRQSTVKADGKVIMFASIEVSTPVV